MSDLSDLARDLAKAADELPGKVEKVVSRGALNVKNDWRDNARRDDLPHGKHYPNTIGYDLERRGAATEAVVGPDSALPQGGMGRGFEYGSVNSPPHLEGNRAADSEEPRFEKAMGDLGDGLL